MTRRLIALLSLLCGAVALVGPAHGQTIDEALATAYLNNPILEAGRAGLRATDEQVPQALANWRPSVDVEGDISRAQTFSNARTSGDKDQIRTPRGVALNITQPLFRGFRTEAEIREAENTVSAERYRLLATEQGVLLDAATAYMDVVRDQAVLGLNVSNEQVLQRQLEATRDRFQVGEITRTDVSQAEARLAGASADRVQAEGDLEAARAAYRNVVGQAPEKLSAPDAPAAGPTDKKDAIATARKDNPNVLAALFDERAARDRVDGVRGELLPNLDLSGKLSRDLESASNTSRVNEKSIKATLSIPLYQSGAVHSRLREARQTVGRERLESEQARRDAEEDATRWWEMLMTARARVESFSAQVDANGIALEGVEREAAVGARTVLDILDAEQELLDSRVNLVGARRDEIVATFALTAAIGQLTARHLNLPVEYYDPGRHYRKVRDKWVGTGYDAEKEENEKRNSGKK
ncbi:MAG: TolC family outer membrane protein [Rhodospirillales bacterium]|jgi:TolC family type I secretion outer membrane protein|nr:TolC family outer membrane protein [Rhodospirillales bacterium]